MRPVTKSLSPGAARVLMIPRDGHRQKRGFLICGTGWMAWA